MKTLLLVASIWIGSGISMLTLAAIVWVYTLKSENEIEQLLADVFNSTLSIGVGLCFIILGPIGWIMLIYGLIIFFKRG